MQKEKGIRREYLEYGFWLVFVVSCMAYLIFSYNSAWAQTTLTLTALRIASGPATVNENSTATYTAIATFVDTANKGTFSTVTPVWKVNSPYASMAANGTLTTAAVTTNQTVTITASYTYGGKTLGVYKNVTVNNLAPIPVPSGSHAGRFSTYNGGATCMPCHNAQVNEVFLSEHYKWAGKLGQQNDYCGRPDNNFIGKVQNINGLTVDTGCTKCHIGAGAKPGATFSTAEAANIDCLMCHADPKVYKRELQTVGGTLKWVPSEALMGKTTIEVASDIRKTTRDTCLNCHSKGGGGNGFKRGDIDDGHRNVTDRNFDVHMFGGRTTANMSCTSCHTVTGHKIPSAGVDLRINEGAKIVCTSCHTTAPHKATATVSAANATLNTHAKRVSCTTCHIDMYAKGVPTEVSRDLSAPGVLNLTSGLYEPANVLQGKLTPQYRWWNGISSVFYNFGTAATPQSNGKVLMAGPAAATITTANAKIYAFKTHTAKLPLEMTATKRIIPLRLFNFYQNGDNGAAITAGQDALGWPRNAYTYQDTERLQGLFHQVSPKEKALGYGANGAGCNQCHNTATPKVPLKNLGYKAGKLNITTGVITPMTAAQACGQCHGTKTYSFNEAHVSNSNHTRQDCSACHPFSKAP